MYTLFMDIVLRNKRGDEYKVLVDDKYSYLSEMSWNIMNQLDSKKTYFRTRINGKYDYLHRHIAGCSDNGMVVDHIDGNTFNNLSSNLRICTRQQNSQNRLPIRGRQYKGVSETKSGKFVATLSIKEMTYQVKYFKSSKEAAIMYNLLIDNFGNEYHNKNKIL